MIPVDPVDKINLRFRMFGQDGSMRYVTMGLYKTKTNPLGYHACSQPDQDAISEVDLADCFDRKHSLLAPVGRKSNIRFFSLVTDDVDPQSDVHFSLPWGEGVIDGFCSHTIAADTTDSDTRSPTTMPSLLGESREAGTDSDPQKRKSPPESDLPRGTLNATQL